jgi:hypothetical protein
VADVPTIRKCRSLTTGDDEGDEGTGSESESEASSDNSEALSEVGDPIPFTAEEIKVIADATPSHWTLIQPTVAERLPINDGPNLGPSNEDLEAMLEVHYAYPFHTSQDFSKVRRRIDWKARRGGDMAVVAGTHCRYRRLAFLMYKLGSDNPMLFSVVGRVSRTGTYCSSDTNWKARRPGQLYEAPFQDIKLRLSIEAIPEAGLQESFDRSLQFLRTLTNENNVFDKRDVFCGNPISRPSIPLSHAVFEAHNKLGESKYSQAVFQWLDAAFKSGETLFYIKRISSWTLSGSLSKDGLKTWQIEEWPTYSSETRNELIKILESHRSMPLPAFSRSLSRTRNAKAGPSPADWSLLKPEQYGSELPNSAVLATFNLVHFAINGKDFWNAIPYSIRLLSGKVVDAYGGDFNPLDGANAALILGSPSVGGSVSSSPIKGTPSKKRKRD